MSITNSNGISKHDMVCKIRAKMGSLKHIDISLLSWLNMAVLLMTIIAFLSIVPAIAVSGWEKSFGGIEEDMAYNIEQTQDGGYVVAGSTNSNDTAIMGNHGSYDGLVIKFDGNGLIEWQKCLGGSKSDFFNSIKKIKNGGYILAGSTASMDGDVIRNNNGYGFDFWVVKLNDTGNIQWQKCLGGSDDDRAFDIQPLNDGGFIVVGYAASIDGNVTGQHPGNCPLVNCTDFWVVRLNDSGDIMWEKCFGGSSWDSANSISLTDDGGYIVAGWTYSSDGNVSSPKGDQDIWIIKLNGIGNIEWEKSLGGSKQEWACDAQQTKDGGYIVIGSTNSRDGDVVGNNLTNDIWLVMLSETGSIQWKKCLGAQIDEGGSIYNYANDINQTTDGGYIITGSTNRNGNQVYLIKTNSLGEKQWYETFGGYGIGYDSGNSVRQTTDRGYILAGVTYSFGNSSQIYMIRFFFAENHPPNDPSIPSGPDSGISGTSYSYSTSSGDPDDDQIKYTFDWGDGTTSETNFVDSGSPASASHSWNAAGTYQIKAMATDNKSLSSNWSGSYTVTITTINHPPNDPSIPSGPDSGISGTSYSYSTSSGDPDDDQIKYTFDWGDGTTSETNFVDSGSPASASHSWNAAGTYQIKAMATDNNGVSSNWSEEFYITIQSARVTCNGLMNKDSTRIGDSVALGFGWSKAVNNIDIKAD
jgi:hypothetical protein